jgi:hypothetical protein
MSEPNLKKKKNVGLMYPVLSLAKLLILSLHSQSMLYGGVLYNIKRKKYKTAL